MKEKLYCVKIGGNIINASDKLESFLSQFSQIEGNKILIHGGGKIATQIGTQLGIESQYTNGRRITDDQTIDLVTMVYGGLINKKITATLQKFHCNAMGLCGADGNIIPAVKRPVKDVDFGWVGDVDATQINIDFLTQILNANITPVFAPLTHDQKGHILNTNADTIAASLATALSDIYDVRLIYCFEKKGILLDIENENSVIPTITEDDFKQLHKSGALFEGIIPKLENAFDAIHNGVHEVLIGHADQINKNTTDQTEGTLIIA